jgi:hypothetical protein
MTNKAALGAIALSVLLLAAGCGKDKPGSVAKAGGETPAAGGTSDGAPPPPQVETTDADPGPATEPDVTPVKNAVEATRSGIRRPPGWAPANAGGNTGGGSAGARARAGLAKYVDWRPRESEGGLSFLAEPAVRRAVAAVRDAQVREFIRNYNGPDAPIAQRKDGRLIAWGCEARNCGFHNWAVAIRPDGSGAEICYYHDDDDPDGTSTWYLAGGRTVKRAGNCPDE